MKQRPSQLEESLAPKTQSLKLGNPELYSQSLANTIGYN